MKIHCLMHVPFEGPAQIADWAESRGHPIAFSHLFAGDALPELDVFDRLVVMGGPMGVGDEDRYPWLRAEKALIRSAIDAGRSLVGVCLGAQLIAEALGAPVSRNPQKEIGWFPIRLTEAARAHPFCQDLPAEQQVLHWHGDTFALPSGALHLAESDACAQQGFLVDGRILGLQFHLEMTPTSLRTLCSHCADELVPDTFVQRADEMLAVSPVRYEETARVLEVLLDRLAG
ncbi:type 1 glutamine amidotransferase [Lamprobacter modestohalophilus]|uniref:type 1 glutamine amidotransferase n=1 Tax=Lamprobacter modestohalophilus TaxID=1064514 RepID=UPI002ADEF9AA|nr:type 1 glutamine amidotransferase [Lamprobacter modestohalophilus]MEA1051662.1 type 1 glutamine amidotransferase [Lamprobacter modestohalophilus]